jgi:PhnB protein
MTTIQIVTPHLVVRDANAALEFYKKALGATETVRMPAEDGKRLMHSEIQVNGARIFVMDDFPEHRGSHGVDAVFPPDQIKGTSVTMHLEVENCDAAVKCARDAGATVTLEPWDSFWGARYARIMDPFGHSWSFAHALPAQGWGGNSTSSLRKQGSIATGRCCCEGNWPQRQNEKPRSMGPRVRGDDQVINTPGGDPRHSSAPSRTALGPCDAVNDDRSVLVVPGSPGQPSPVPGAAFAPVPEIQPLHPLQQAADQSGGTRCCLLDHERDCLDTAENAEQE